MNNLIRDGIVYIVLCSFAYYIMRDNYFILLCTIALMSLIHRDEEDKLSKRIKKLEEKNE